MGGRSRAAIASDAQEKADAQLLEYQEQAKAQKAILEKQKQEYKQMEIVNPYAENVFEDLTVNQQQAQFEAQQGAQQRADILGGLRGAAGGSGIAGLAQAMANQGQLQAQRMSASIGQQEAMNQRLRAQGAQQRQAGEAMVQQAESSRISTLLGMEYGEMAGIRQGEQMAQQNQMSAMALEAEMKAANQQMWGSIIGGGLGAIGTIAGASIGAAGAKEAANIAAMAARK